LGGVLAVGTQVYINHKILIVPMLLSATALFLFFLRLRIFDEFKDYDHDLKYYSHRPVPRGLISKKELIGILAPLIILEFVIAFFSGKDGFVLFLISFAYSLLMFKEFFVKRWIKNHFTTYILSHEILLFPLFFYLCAINGFRLIFVGDIFFWFLVIYVGLSMFLLEITRKVRHKEAEIASRDTYTAQYGILGASLLLLGISLGAIISLGISINLLGLSYVSLVTVSSLFLIFFCWRLYEFNKKPTIDTSKKVFLSSIYFVFISCIATIFILIKL
jgi:4-hydroxybenzoate polyprenyltransferase